jgi:hypothetical protein
MRKRYLSITLIVIVLVITIIYFLTLASPISVDLNQPQNQENQTQETGSPFTFPFFPQSGKTSNKSGGGGGGGGGGSTEGGGGGGGSTEQPTSPKINYTLNIYSSFEDLDFITFYYLNDVFQNITYKVPYSLPIDADTTACVGLVSSYTGTYWDLDGTVCSMTACGGYPNGCNILMDKPHDITLRQYS